MRTLLQFRHAALNPVPFFLVLISPISLISIISLSADLPDEGSSRGRLPGAVLRALHGPHPPGVHLRQAHPGLQVSAPRRPGHPAQVVRVRGAPRQTRRTLREPGT